jgi:hypothetical protein
MLNAEPKNHHLAATQEFLAPKLEQTKLVALLLAIIMELVVEIP